MRRSASHLLVASAGALSVAFIAPSAEARRGEEPRMMLELAGGTYKPDVDSAFDGASPWKDAFGDGSMTLLRGEFDYQFLRGFGSLGVGFGAGYGWIDGKAVNADGDATDDEVGFNLAPMTVSLVYRWDWAAVEHGVPLVPYVKAGLTAAFWWATDAKDNIATARDDAGDTRRGTGVTFGWHAGGGLMLLLDVFSGSMAASLEDETGVRNSYLFAELMYQNVNDFGASDSIDLSETAFSFGLAFEF